MAMEFKLQDPGEGIHEAEIRELLVAPGDRVEEGQDVMVVETDKAAVELPSPFTGVVSEIRFEPGDVAEVGDVLMTFEEAASADRSGAAQREESSKDDRDDSDGEPRTPDRDGEQNAAEGKARKDRKEGREPAKPRSGETEEVAGRGAGDRPADTARSNEAKKSPEKAEESDVSPVPATPAVRRIARELGVELEDVQSHGDHDRVTEDDVRDFAAQGARDENAAAGEDGAPATPDFERWGEVERVRLPATRRAVAEHTARAWREIPHVTHQDVIDISEIETFRRRYKSEIEGDGGDGAFTPTVIVLKAVTVALREHPSFNASLDETAGELVLKKHYHLGVAVDTDRGLLVPVVRDVDHKSLVALSAEVAELAARTRAGNIAPDDMKGGTFTVTNIGALGGTGFTPIINHPQVAILGLARSRPEPVIEGDLERFQVVPRLILPVSLAFDHRVIDGADAARFVSTLKDVLSDPEHLALMA